MWKLLPILPVRYLQRSATGWTSGAIARDRTDTSGGSLDRHGVLPLVPCSSRPPGVLREVQGLPSGYVKIAIEDVHRNSGFSH